MAKTRVTSHPGEILQHEFMTPLKLTSRALAKALNVPANRISEILAEKRSMTADTAHRLAKYFRTSPEFWMNLQTAHDLSKVATRKTYVGIKAAQIRPKAVPVAS